MDKGRIKNFATTARKKLMDAIKSRAALMGVTSGDIAEPVDTGPDYERYEAVPGASFMLSGDDVKKREGLARRVREKGFDAVIEEVAYTWFNRLIAVRFMEVNDYLPTRTRVLSSSAPGSVEPDIIKASLDIDLGLSEADRARVIELRTRGDDRAMTELFSMLFVRQCNKLGEILPELFVRFDRTADYTELLLNISYLTKEGVVRDLVDNIPEDDFREAVEIVGWMYQYYNSEVKDETFALLKKNVKVTRERIPSATQLFTPDWIVRYMVENSLGRLWLESHPDDTEANAKLRGKWRYYVDEAEQEPAVADTLRRLRAENKINSPEDITFIDSCMGSGHILVYAFDVLMDIYRACGYTERDAARLILEKNLYGFDIDYRAYQLAYFAVLMKARVYSRRILSEGVRLNLSLSYAMDSIQYSHSAANVVIDRAKLDYDKKKLKDDIDYLLQINRDALDYGSLVEVKQMNWAAVETAVERLMAEGVIKDFADILRLVKQARILSGRYDVVCTNPPYMGSSNMNTKLSDYMKNSFKDSKSDISTAFMERALDMCKVSGLIAMINIPVWMFLSSYEKLREKIITGNTIVNMIHFGRGVFGSDFGTTSFVIAKTHVEQYKGVYRRLFEKQGAVDNLEQKEKWFFEGFGYHTASADNFAKIPGSPVAYWVSDSVVNAYMSPKTKEFFIPKFGMSVGDVDRFVRNWFELVNEKISASSRNLSSFLESKKKWCVLDKGGPYRKWSGNREFVVLWENNGEEIKKHPSSAVRNPSYFFQPHISWTLVTSGVFSARFFEKGFILDTASNCLYCGEDNRHQMQAMLALLNSKVANYLLGIQNPTLNMSCGVVAELPCKIQNTSLEYISGSIEQNISISRTDWDSFETSWDFQTHPFFTHKGDTIEASFDNWQAFADSQFAQLKSNEEELNRIFIEIYGLQDELTPEVEDKDVTIRRADRARDVRSFISYAVGCMFGRYSPDTPGLCFAGGEWDDAKYQTFKSDPDNIIPITDDEYFPDDIVSRLVEFVRVTYGATRLEENLTFIARSISDKSDTPRSVIRNYFVRDFYKDHIKIYKKRPIYWLFDSGKQDAFKALIYLHRYDENIVGNIRTNYLHRTQTAIARGIAACDAVIDSDAPTTEKSRATKRREKLNKQLAEITQYDQAIAHVALQRIKLDLDDGVKVNYAKFQGIGTGGRSGEVDLLGKLE